MKDNNKDKIKILVVEDTQVFAKTLKNILEKEGYQVILAKNGIEGINLLKNNLFNLIISDIEMPEMDGYTLTAEIRHDSRMQKVHILLHTSLSGVFNQAMVKKVGADDFLAKFRPDDLASRVAERINAVDSH